MKNIKLWRRRKLKKIAVLPMDFTGALLAKTKNSGVVVLTMKNGRVVTYITDIAEENDDTKYCIRQARKVLKNANMSDFILYEWENVGDSFEQLMFVYGGELNPQMSCVKC